MEVSLEKDKLEEEKKPHAFEKKMEGLLEKIRARDAETKESIVPETKASPTAPREKPQSFSNTLKSLSREGRFSVEHVAAGNEFPTLLTRIPIFIPTRRNNQRDLLDIDNSIRFNTSWGQGRKFGPPLTTYDEDTLIAIGRLRQHQITGHSHQFPVPINSPLTQLNSQETQVFAACFLISDLQAICKTTPGGAANKNRLESVKRLAATVIELTAESKDKYTNYGTSIKLIDVAWEEYEKNSLLYIQFSPLMSLWYQNEYTFIDFKTRIELTDVGKAIHRFLSSQPKRYEIYTAKLQETIMYKRPYKKFMYDLRSTLKDLERLEWLNSYEIVGSGRNNPHKLIIHR